MDVQKPLYKACPPLACHFEDQAYAIEHLLDRLEAAGADDQSKEEQLREKKKLEEERRALMLKCEVMQQFCRKTNQVRLPGIRITYYSTPLIT